MSGDVMDGPARPGRWRSTRSWPGLVIRRWETAVAALVVVAGAGTALFTVWAVFRLHVELLTWDTWFTETDARMIAEGHYGLADLMRQHNEHRIAFPRLVFAIDILFFSMSERFDLAVSFALQAANAAIILRLVQRRVAAPPLRWLVAGFIVLVMFSLRQEENFANGFQVQFIGVFTAAMLTALAFVAGLDRVGAANLPGPARGGGWPRLALAWLGCLVATYTLASGVMLGFTLVALALASRAPWRPVLATLAVAIALAALFFHDYQKGGDSKPLVELVLHPRPYLSYLAIYLGNPFGNDILYDRPIGAAGVAGFAWLGWRVATGRDRSTATAALLGIAGFMLATACATSFGRIGLGVEQATEGRYATPSAIFWCALVAAAFPRPAGGLPARAGSLAVAALMIGLAAVSLYFEGAAWPWMTRHAADIRRFRDSLWSGLYDRQASAYENNDQGFIVGNLPFLREHRLSLFADPLPFAFGKPASSVGAPAPASACFGTVVALRADPDLGTGGVRASGTAWDAVAHGPVTHIVALDPAGVVVGFGSPDKVFGRNHDWTGFAMSRPGVVLTIEALLHDGRLCRIGAGEVSSP